jgi:predicted dehydrogenase
MKFLIIGLGSMGKRRIRNLRALGQGRIAGYDPREDRRAEVESQYGVPTFASYEEALLRFDPTALIISTGPRHHMDYALPAVEMGFHCFIEASVVERERILELNSRIRSTTLVMAPSCTLRYYPGPRAVKKAIGDGLVGKPLSISYQTGQYLPDWHPWEQIGEFYVSDRDTGGCREIVPFELTWLNDIFGHPAPVACVRAKLTELDADIDDVYHCILRYPGGIIANLTVEVISRPIATRELRVLGTEGILVFSGEERCVRHLRVGETDWVKIPLSVGTVEAGYINPEEPYIAELGDFIRAVEASDPTLFPNSLEEDARVLGLLSTLDQLSTE